VRFLRPKPASERRLERGADRARVWAHAPLRSSSPCSCSSERPAANWPAWRVPQADGRGKVRTILPLKWSADEREMEDRTCSNAEIDASYGGNSHLPTQAVGPRRRTVMCLIARTGTCLAGSPTGISDETHASSESMCSGSPVNDGERVIDVFGSRVYACDLAVARNCGRNIGKPTTLGIRARS